MKFYKSLLLIVLLIVITLPRFNWKPLPEPFNSFVGQKPFDVEQYEKYVEYFRGDSELREELESPFTYRPLIPLLASFLPFDALTSINLINLLLLSTGLIFLLNLLRQLKFSEALVTIGGLLFVFSFPVFYYATSGYIDASLVGIILTANYFLVRNKFIPFIGFFILGVLIKETIIILLPVAAIYLLSKKNSKENYTKIILIIILYFLIESMVRYFAPGSDIYVWKPSSGILSSNLSRIKTYLSFILTFGLPGLLSIPILVSKMKNYIPKEISYSFIIGMIASLLLWFYSIFAAYSDGRQLWTSYPFTIVLSVYLIQLIRYQNISSKNIFSD